MRYRSRVSSPPFSRQDWLARGERSWWPRFLFHYTDVQNAAAVLEEGTLHSRDEAERRRLLHVSSGDPNILRETDRSIKECVRLYFRPKTPTQYHAEGIMSSDQIQQAKYPDAHCPVPVFLLFDAVSILTRGDSRFYPGSLRSATFSDLRTASDLTKFPWKKIYHNTWYDRRDSNIKYHRMAEVAVPSSLSLDSLKYVYCRSQAEKETLLALLSADTYLQYLDRVTSSTRYSLFYRLHTYLRTCRLFPDHIDMDFSPDTQSPGPFHFTLTVQWAEGTFREERNDFFAKGPVTLRLGRKLTEYDVRIELDGHLAYKGDYCYEIPF